MYIVLFWTKVSTCSAAALQFSTNLRLHSKTSRHRSDKSLTANLMTYTVKCKGLGLNAGSDVL